MMAVERPPRRFVLQLQWLGDREGGAVAHDTVQDRGLSAEQREALEHGDLDDKVLFRWLLLATNIEPWYVALARESAGPAYAS